MAKLRPSASVPWSVRLKPETGTFVMAVTILVLGFYLMYPMVIVLLMSFNTARDVLVGPAQWGLGNWIGAWDQPLLLRSIFNSFLVWFLTAGTAFPIAIAIALILARTRIPGTHFLEYGFWIAYMFPGISTTIGWMMLLDPDSGFVNITLEALPFVDDGPFNIYSLPGIIWVKLMGDGIAYKVMLFTPAFRNMDRALEEAGRVSGASSLSTMFRVTIPVMISPIVLVLALQLIRIFGGFETEWLLGRPFGFYVYSTLIYRLITIEEFPQYGMAVVLGSLTMIMILLIIPLQRWIVQRRQYTTVTGTFKPGLIELGIWRWMIFGGIIVLLMLLTVIPLFVLGLGSVMARVGFFNTTPLWTLAHWEFVLGHPLFQTGLRTTLILSTVAAVGSPLLFSVVAYMLVRTRWRGRTILDSIIWLSAAIPGIIASLGLLIMFLSTPGLAWLYGSIWALIIVVIISGNTTGTNLFKGVMVQLGKDMEEAARVSGAGWLRTYFKVVIPVLMPTMILIGTLNFVQAAGATASIILLASRETITLSILALQWGSDEPPRREAASIVSIIILVFTLGVAMVARHFGLKVGIRHDQRAGDEQPSRQAEPEPSRAGR